MTETAKTLVFIAIGAVALLGAYFLDAGSQPIQDEELVGASLNSTLDVDDPKGLRIIKFEPATASTREFKVAAVDGVWRIPSKEDYPADATRQMAEAANALIDRRILRVNAKSADAHDELGVADPLSGKLDSNSRGVGTRVIMTDADEKVLVDMIIGKKVKDAEGQRYVRNSNQDIVYVVELNADSLSTNFDKWIEDDLLKLSPFDIRKVFINDYSAELSLGMTPDGQIVPQVNWDRRGEITLNYSNDEAKWQLAELKKFDRQKGELVEDAAAEDEEVNQDSLGELRTGLDDLLIVDVAKKPAGLSDSLKAGDDFLKNREAREDLLAKGFSPVPLKDGAPEILSSEGEVVCTMRDGVEYVLRFGQLQVQTDSAADGEEPPSEAEGDDAAAKPGDEAAAEKKPDDSSDEKNLRRYLFVMARFNGDIIEQPKLKELPPLPEGAEAPAETAPATEGEAPAEEPAADAPGGDQPEAAGELEPTDEETPSEEPTAGAAADAEAVAEDPAATEPPAEGAEADPKSSELERIMAERKAIEEENQRLLDEYKETVDGGKKKVTELNQRFGDWYYVISNDVYKQIHLGRAQVIKKKEKPAEAGGAPGGEAAADDALSGLPKLPGGVPAEPAADVPAEPAAASETAPAETAPAEPPPAEQ